MAHRADIGTSVLPPLMGAKREVSAASAKRRF